MSNDSLTSETVAMEKIRIAETLTLDRASFRVSPIYNLIEIDLSNGEKALLDIVELRELKKWIDSVLPAISAHEVEEFYRE